MAVTDQPFNPTPPSPSGALAAGAMVAGRYRVVSKLGEGGMGAVYRAVQEPLGREVALKVIAPALATDGDAVERFRREAKAASSLSHPHIVTVFDFGTDSGLLFIAMELITGEGLDDVVKRGPMPARRAIPILRGVATALAEAHARGIVHRDLKPPNVMLTSTSTQNDVVKVVDFGIARMADGGGRTLTQTGAVVGTPGYVAPELFDGAQPSPSSDLYALGVVAYELLGGTSPFPGGTPREILKAVLFGEPLPLRRFARDAPEALEALVMSLLARDPGKRPASAKDVDVALAAIDLSASSLPPLPPPPPMPEAGTSTSPSTRVMAPAPTPATSVFMTEAMAPPARSLSRPPPPPTPPVVVSSSPPAKTRAGVPGWVIAAGISSVCVFALPFALGDDGDGGGSGGASPHGDLRIAITPDGASLNGIDLVALRSMAADPTVKATLVTEARSALTDPDSTDEDKAEARALLSLIEQPASTTVTKTATAAAPTRATTSSTGGMPESVRTTLLSGAEEALRDHTPVVAEAKLLKLLEYRPDDVEAVLMLSNVYAQTGRPQGARFERQRFIELAPSHPKAPQVRQFLDQHLDDVTVK